MNFKKGANLIVVFILFLSFSARAQLNEAGSIIEELQKPGYSGAVINIYADTKINNLLGKPGVVETGPNGELFIKASGYRVQVFSGNLRESKDEAQRKERQVREVFPTHRAYVTYKAPFWRLRVGDFHSQDEATRFMRELKKVFPSFSKEMSVVPDEVRIILH